ncbi:FAD-dependent monooxygenase [Streptacidiphilus jiangxiensis]|uniref:Anthraniloyl-CoA monooxygenase n=1 Tax=Streptacidiphilus jiangxiensis TaxID=235985 RepID=A0A1H7P252_STRJI|nr:FAD-dependent monooxygenase [Streptacidiphilus jiangxiensis]SEL29883.1 anthraniloyl-CoA monooxygenase [Streptacidiphilus jiangxiensis]
MRIAVIGGGPGGLYTAALAKQLSPEWEVVVWERNARDAAFGFGVVFSDETLSGIAQADPTVFAALEAEFARWSDIDIHYAGRLRTSGGHGFAALDRNRLREILQQRCAELGVEVHYGTPAPPVADLSAQYDLVVAADGVRSQTRAAYADEFGVHLDERTCRYMWLATDRVFEAFTFIVEECDFGVLQVHAYPYDEHRSTFIVEMEEDAWRRGGFAELADREFARGESDEASVRRCEELLADHLDGCRLIPNASRWITFSTVRTASWSRGNIVLLGDAAHTAHFSIGSGTKLAMEDALALVAGLHEQPTVAEALAAYEAERRPAVESVQRAAQASLEWFETIGRYRGQDPDQFAFNLLTRSRRVTYGNLRARDLGFVDAVDAAVGDGSGAPPMFQPLRLAGLRLRNRVVVPPLATFTAVEGVPDAFEQAQLTTQALGGAGLVFAGMTAVSPEGRASLACPGLWNDRQTAAWRDIVAAVREVTDTPLGIQLTHAGRRGSTAVPGADGVGRPLGGEEGWPTLAASALAWDAGYPAPREATPGDLTAVARDFAAAARRALHAGFDVLELQFGHGHLVSGFLSPLTNRRSDAYGGDLRNRLRFPCEVLAAVRAVWPAAKPLVVRISATDWAANGTNEAEAVEISRALADAGADAIDVSTGEVVAHQRPAYGRTYQTPYADLIRHATGVPTVAVGAVSSYDDVNSILLAGRADLVAVGRGHLYDPQWTLHAAADQGYSGPGARWPEPWQAGSSRPPGPRSDRVPPRLQLLRAAAAPVHRRWQPRMLGRPAPATASC